MKHSKRRTLLVAIITLVSSLACNYVYVNQVDQAATRMALTPESNDAVRPETAPENDPHQVSGTSTCAPLEIFEADVRKNEELSPDVLVYANGEETAPPDGFRVDYPALPDSASMSTTARVLVQQDAKITASTDQAVSCAGVLLIGDVITPATIYLDGKVIWDGYLYPPVDASPRPFRIFYIRFAVEPARSVSVSIKANATGNNSTSIWVPVEGFGFTLP
jgi:hypothetical protein